MSSTWEYKPLGKICDVIAGQSPEGKYYNKEGKGLPFYQGKKEFGDKYIGEPTTWTTKVTKEAVAGDILMSVRAPVGPINFANEKICIGRGLAAIRAKDGLDRDFLYYGLLSKQPEISGKDGAVFASINRGEISAIEFPVPPLKEQQLIVAILDEAFAGIATATANAEKNLQNARELFDSYLHSLSYETKPLGALVEIKTGKLNANAAVEGGEYPFFTCSREISQIDNYAFDREAILLAGNNASGDFNVKHYHGKFNAYQRTYVITVKNNADLLYRYLYYQMLKGLKDLKESSVGAGTKFLKLGMIQNFQIALADVAEQKQIVEKLDRLSDETKRLEGIYQQKLEELADLKQSILQKAFAGELH